MPLHGTHPRRRSTDREPNPGWVPTLLIAAGVIAVDWSTKALIAANLEVGAVREVIDGRLAFIHVKNPEMMLGLWGNLAIEVRMVIAWTAAVLAMLVLADLVARSHRLDRRHRAWSWIFTGLMAGGIFGNLGERAIYWHVTDFLSLHAAGIWLPPGNVADLAMILAMPLVVPVTLFELQARRRRRTRTGPERRSGLTPAVASAIESDG
jgi:lipoprotein signal peptidase